MKTSDAVKIKRLKKAVKFLLEAHYAQLRVQFNGWCDNVTRRPAAIVCFEETEGQVKKILKGKK